MQVECVFTATLNGKYVNCSTIYPVGGMEFSLDKDCSGLPTVAGTYRVSGVLRRADFPAKGDNPARAVLFVKGAVVPAVVTVK